MPLPTLVRPTIVSRLLQLIAVVFLALGVCVERTAAAVGPPATISVHVVDSFSLQSTQLAAVFTEMNGIWARYRVSVRPVREKGDVVVLVTAQKPRRSLGADLAWIQFASGTSPARITVSPHAVRGPLLEPGMPRGPIDRYPRILRETLVARVLGRALSHEIGH